MKEEKRRGMKERIEKDREMVAKGMKKGRGSDKEMERDCKRARRNGKGSRATTTPTALKTNGKYLLPPRQSQTTVTKKIGH